MTCPDPKGGNFEEGEGEGGCGGGARAPTIVASLFGVLIILFLVAFFTYLRIQRGRRRIRRRRRRLEAVRREINEGLARERARGAGGAGGAGGGRAEDLPELRGGKEKRGV